MMTALSRDMSVYRL